MSEKRGRRRIYEILSPYVLTAIVAVSAMVFFVIFWFVKGDEYERTVLTVTDEQYGAESISGSETGSQSAENGQELISARQDIISQPEVLDGSGRAGVCLLSDEMKAVSNEAGKYSNDIGTWYAPGRGCCYYSGWVTLDGNQYHFDSEGYLDYGWKLIGGSVYYFDENGVYNSDKDSSMMIAFTFDDGPSEYTSQILDTLEQYNVKATFMMVGQMIARRGGDVIPRMLADGDTIGNHSYNHSNMLELNSEEVSAEFSSVDSLLAQYGTTSTVMRFPYGNYTEEYVKLIDKPQILWDLDSRDWESQDVDSIINKIYSELQPGEVILMHDLYSETAQSFQILLPQLIEMGYEPVTIEVLAASKGYELMPGVTYRGFSQTKVDNGGVIDG